VFLSVKFEIKEHAVEQVSSCSPFSGRGLGAVLTRCEKIHTPVNTIPVLTTLHQYLSHTRLSLEVKFSVP